MISVTSDGRKSCHIETIGSNNVIAAEVVSMLLAFQKDNSEILDIVIDLLDKLCEKKTK